MPSGRPWSRDELLAAMNLYCRLPFGQLHQRNPVIVHASRAFGRTPSSLVMKLCNFASLDPAHQIRGVTGLPHVSSADREIWGEFNEDWGTMGAESELALERLLGGTLPGGPAMDETMPGREEEGRLEPEHRTLDGPTEIERTLMARRGQAFFRRAVLSSYRYQCAVTGNPVPELLVASHIMPWSEFPQERMNPQNGICLAAHFDRAFDEGLVTFDENLRLVVSPVLRSYLPNQALEAEFVRRQNQRLVLPDKFLPAPHCLEHHRDHVFRVS